MTGEDQLDKTSDFYYNNLHTREDFSKDEWTDDDLDERSKDGSFVSIGKYVEKRKDEFMDGDEEYEYVFDDMVVADFRGVEIYKKLTPPTTPIPPPPPTTPKPPTPTPNKKPPLPTTPRPIPTPYDDDDRDARPPSTPRPTPTPRLVKINAPDHGNNIYQLIL